MHIDQTQPDPLPDPTPNPSLLSGFEVDRGDRVETLPTVSEAFFQDSAGLDQSDHSSACIFLQGGVLRLGTSLLLGHMPRSL